MSVTLNGTSGLVFSDGTIQGTAAGNSFRNRIINGDMRIDQRNNGASISGSIGYANNYVPDRFATALNLSNNSTISLQQVVDAPSGFYNSLKVTATSATAQSTSNQYFFVAQAIEMRNVLDFNFVSGASSPCVLSFWVKASVTGVYSANISWGNGSSILSGLLRGYAAEYTVTTANVWQYVTVSIPTDTFVSTLSLTQTINIIFDLGSGVNYSKAPNSWISNSRTRSTNQTVFLNTVAGATFQITGVQFEKAAAATSFENRSYGTELALCQRYYWVEGVASSQVIENMSTVAAAPVVIPLASLPVMRVTPTCTAPTVSQISTINYSGVYADVNASVLRVNGSWSALNTRAFLIFNSGNFTASAEL